MNSDVFFQKLCSLAQLEKVMTECHVLKFNTPKRASYSKYICCFNKVKEQFMCYFQHTYENVDLSMVSTHLYNHSLTIISLYIKTHEPQKRQWAGVLKEPTKTSVFIT